MPVAQNTLANQPTDAPLLNQVTDYWTQRALGYSQHNQQELASQSLQKWQQMLLSQLPNQLATQRPLTIVDMGTGPGFMAILMAQAGHRVIGVDATTEMLQQAQQNALAQQVQIEWLQGDVQQLPLADESVDCVISRNLTWNLQNPAQAYAEWYRVLKKGGTLINFDANWYLYLFDKSHEKGFLADRANTARLQIEDHYANTDTRAMEAIARQLPLSQQARPAWDKAQLRQLGFTQIEIDLQINQKLLTQVEQINYRSTPMFMIVAKK